MSRKKRSISAKELSRAIVIRFFIALVVYSAGLVLAFIVCTYIASSYVWHGNELLYPLLHMVNNNRALFLAFCWLAGFIVIFLIFWRKPFNYIDTIVEASNLLVDSTDELIQLPPELRLVEDRMNRIKQEANRNASLAREAEQRKNDMIVYLAHDLKTPLTSVIGYLTLLRDEPQISEELRSKYLSVSLDKAERLEDLINEFFEITRFNLSEMTLDVGRVNLTRMLEQIVFEFKPLFAEKNLQCSLHCPPNIEMKFDIAKMERVFDNMIRNAINYSFENSTMEIEVSPKKDKVILCFRNSGNTVPKEKLDRIFEQFFRLDTSRATRTGGAGLGLAIAKQIIELHHGTITASSENEQITFTVELPIVTIGF